MSIEAARDSQPTRLQFKFAPVLGGALASGVAALIGSRLGLTGTLVGAAVTSIVIGAVAQVATFGFVRTHEGLRRPGVIGEPPSGTAPTKPADAAVVRTASGRRRIHPAVFMASIAATSVATFALAMVLLTAYEASAGRSADGNYSTTIGGAFNGAPQTASPSVSATVEPSSTASASPTVVAPSATASVSASPVTSASATQTVSPSASASVAVSAQGVPSASATSTAG